MADNRDFNFARLDADFFFRVAFRFGLRFHCFQFQGFEDCVEQIVQSSAMFGGNGKQFSDT